MSESETKRPLEGIGDLGRPYDVTQEYASTLAMGNTPLFDFGFDPNGWDPNTAEETDVIWIYSQPYYFPPNLYTVTEMDTSTSMFEDFKEAKSFALDLELGLDAKVRSGMFRASLKTNFTFGYASSSYYWSMTKRSLVRSYTLAFKYPDKLKDYLTDDARADINGSMSPVDLIAKYGTHVYVVGLYGGILTYSQSVSRFEYKESYEAEAEIQAHYAAMESAAVYGSVYTDGTADTTQSTGIFYAIGGSPSALEAGYTSWATSLEEGNFALIDFADDAPLIPLSELADNTERREEILNGINAYVGADAPAGNELTELIWDDTAPVVTLKDTNYEGHAPQISIEVENTSQVIVGFGTCIVDGKAERCYIRILDLADPTEEPLYRFEPDTITSYDPAHYEVDVDLAKLGIDGVAVTGLGLSAESHSDATHLTLHYQYLEPANEDGVYLDSKIYDNPDDGRGNECDVQPADSTAGRVATKIAFGVSDKGNNIESIEVDTYPLIRRPQD